MKNNILLLSLKNNLINISKYRIIKYKNHVKKSYELAEFHAQRAVEALQRLPASDARSALLRILHVAISRDK